MSGIGIGTHDRGMWDREDQLYVKPEALKSNISAREAEEYAKSKAGAEVILKNADGTYSVYQLTTSEDGKAINNSDFKDDSVILTKDVAKQFQNGKKAYVVTSDNVIRSLDLNIKGIELANIDQNFIKAKLFVTIEDKDGVETKAQNDLEGTISGKISISKELIEYSLAKASKQKDIGLKLLSVNPATNEYVIEVTKGVRLGNVILKMEQGSINTRFDASGLVNAAAGALNGLAASGGGEMGMSMNYNQVPQIDPEAIAADMVKENLSKDLGLKVTQLPNNQLKLEPDFKNTKLLGKIPVGDMNLVLNEVISTPQNTDFKLDSRGDIQITLKNTKIIGSSDSDATPVKQVDTEGPDSLTADLEGNLSNDMSANLDTKATIKVNITDSEKAALNTRIKTLSGMGVSITGSAEVSDIKVNTKLDTDGKITVSKPQSGKIKAENLNVDMGSAVLKVASTTGDLNLEEVGSRTTLKADNVTIKGGVQSPLISLDFNEFVLNGKITHDQNDPNKIKLESDINSGIDLSMSIKDNKKQNILDIDKFKLRGADIEFDVSKGNMVLAQKPGSPNIELDKLKVGDTIDLKNIKLKGKLELNAFSGQVIIEGNEIGLTGKFGNVTINNLKGSGKITHTPEKGIKVENANISSASGKIGTFDISRFRGKGDINFDNNGDLVLANASALEIDTAIGLKVKGDVKVAHKDGIYNFTSASRSPLNISYKPDGKEESVVSGLVITGNINFDSNKKTFSFNNADKPLNIKQGSIAGVAFNNFILKGQVKLGDDHKVILSGHNGETSVSGSVAGINVKEIKSSGAITVDPDNKSISASGGFSIDVPDKKLNLQTSGDINLSQDKEGRYIFTSKNGTLNGKIGAAELKDFVVDGRVIYDPKTGEIKLDNTDSQELKVSGAINGRKLSMVTSGAINLTKDKAENIKIATQGLKVKGELEGFNIDIPEGVKGEVNLSKEGKLLGVTGFKLDFNIDGVSLENRGGVSVNDAGGYQVKLSGNIASDKGKLSEFFGKLSKSSLVPESSKGAFDDLNYFLQNMEVKDLQYDDLTLNLDKNFAFDGFKVTGKDLKVNIPDKNIKFSSSGDVTYELDKEGKMSFTCKDKIINASVGTTQFKDFMLNGKITYDQNTNSFGMEGTDNSALTIKGKIDDKKIALSAKAAVNLVKKDGDLEFSGENIKIDGNIDGFKVESLSGASGNFVVKKDGLLDLSKLKFAFKIDDITLSNTDGSLKGGADTGYEIKLDGKLGTSQENLLKFLDKIAKNGSTSAATKQSIDETIKNIHNYMIYGDLKDGKYNDFTIKLDKDFNFQNFHVDTKMSLENTSIKLGLGENKENKVNLGRVDFSANISSDTKEFNIKNGSISFKMTDDVKKSIAGEAKNVLTSFGLKDIELTVNDVGQIKINKATFDGLPIVNVDLAMTTTFQGTKLIFNLDRAHLTGFLGSLAQGFMEGVGVDTQSLAVRKTVEKLDDIKINYKGGDHKFSINLEEILYQYVSEEIKLNNVEVSDGKFKLDYEVNAGGSKPFNPTKVNEGVTQIKALVKKDSSAETEKLKNLLVASEPQDLSRMLDRVTLLGLKNKLDDENKLIPVMTKLANSHDVGKNAAHLDEIASYLNDTNSFAFQKGLTNEQLYKLAPETKAKLVMHLADGHTDGAEEQAMKRIILNSSPADLAKVLDRVSAERLEDELDDKDYFEILKMVSDCSKVANNEAHLQNFLKNSNHDVTSALINRIPDTDIKNLSVNSRVRMIKNLMDGDTDANLEQLIKRIMVNSAPVDVMKIIDQVTLARFKDELDSKDVTDILRVANRK
jgi:hypothetical protein